VIDITRKPIRHPLFGVVAYEFVVIIDGEFVCRGEVTSRVWDAWWQGFGGWSKA